MIELYYWTTPNGHKITMFLEETGLPYIIKPVNISTGAQFDPDFLAIAPNNRIPAIIDREPAGGGAPLALFESGAILLYLAEKSRRLLPAATHARFEVIQWLFWQVAGLGPMAGQNHHFARYAPGAAAVRHHALRERDESIVRRARPPTRRPRLHRRRGLLDRRHRLLPLDRASRGAGPEARGLRPSEALVRKYPALGRRRCAPTRRRSRSTPSPP